MIGSIEDFKTGWHGLSFAFTGEELDKLIDSLKYLKDNPDGHFHLSSKFLDGDAVGVSDVEFSVQGADETDNMQFG